MLRRLTPPQKNHWLGDAMSDKKVFDGTQPPVYASIFLIDLDFNPTMNVRLR